MVGAECFFKSSADAISAKMEHLEIDIGDYRVAHFIDCNCLETSVAGGGPAESGTGAARWDDTIQRSFYR